MLRLFLRLYVILAIGLAAAIWLVNYTFDELLPEANETYNREALRGPAYGLVEQLRPLRGTSARPGWTSCKCIMACASSWCPKTPRR